MRRVVLVALALVAAQFVMGGAANAIGPDAVAWWNIANSGVVAPPPPPDVAPGQLLVQGAEAAQQAVAALRFTVGDQQTVRALSVELASPPPVPPVLKLCRVDGEFKAVENGPWSEVPPSDCADQVEGVVNGPVVTFDGVGRFVREGRLSVILIPVEPTRVVIAAPDNRALDASEPFAPSTEAPSDFAAFGSAELLPELVAPAAPFTDVGDLPTGPLPSEATATPAPAAADAGAGVPFPGVTRASNPFEESSFRTKLVSAVVMFVFLAPFAFAGRRIGSRRRVA